MTQITVYVPARDAVKTLAKIYGIRMRDVAAIAIDKLIDSHNLGRKIVTPPNIEDVIVSKIEKINQQ